MRNPPNAFEVAWEIFKKDVRIELRTREVIATAGVFSVVVGFLASMAFHVDDRTNPSVAAGTIWITVFFASVLSFGRIWQRERDESALTGLLVAPIPRASIFLGKAMATFMMIVMIAIPLVLLCLFLFRIDIGGADSREHDLALVGFLAMGSLSLSLIGTLFGAMTVRTRARDLVLAIVLFPLLSPVLVCGVVGTRKAFEHQAFETYSGFLGLMGASVAIALLFGVALFGTLLED